MDAVIYLVIVLVIAVGAVRLGMIVAPWIGRMAPADDESGASPAEEPSADPHTPGDEEPG